MEAQVRCSRSTKTMSTTSLLRLFCTLLAVSYSYPEFGRALEAPKDIFILAGQSNMAGRGGVRHGKWDGNVPPECRPNPSILRLNPQLQWEEAHEPLHTGIGPPKTQGWDPAWRLPMRSEPKVPWLGLWDWCLVRLGELK